MNDINLARNLYIRSRRECVFYLEGEIWVKSSAKPNLTVLKYFNRFMMGNYTGSCFASSSHDKFNLLQLLLFYNIT